MFLRDLCLKLLTKLKKYGRHRTLQLLNQDLEQKSLNVLIMEGYLKLMLNLGVTWMQLVLNVIMGLSQIFSEVQGEVLQLLLRLIPRDSNLLLLSQETGSTQYNSQTLAINL